MSSEIIGHLELNSASGTQLNMEALYQIAPSVFTEARDAKTGQIARKVDFDALRVLLGDAVKEEGGESYQFTWVGKRAAKAEAARPTDKTLRPVVEDSVDWNNTKNLYIEGDNLEVLKLLQRSYMGGVKMIYIDPPYNTGNDFVYNDDFARTAAEEDLEAGNVDELGLRYRKNTDSNGKFHSDWCSMIYSRLLVARSLLTEDGVIFISIDDNELTNLRKICDEIFGSSNFEATIIPISNPGGRDYKQVAITNEYLLIYSKSGASMLNEMPQKADFKFSDSYGGYEPRELRNRNPKFHSGNRPNLFYPFFVNPNLKDNNGYCPVSLQPSEDYTIEVKPYNSQGSESVWRWGKPRAAQNILLNSTDRSQIIARQKSDGNWNIYEKCRRCTIKAKSLWDETEMRTENGTREVRSLFGSTFFDHPKPLGLLKRCVIMGSDEDSLVLDFFSGSSTTAHAVMQFNAEDGGNRKFIMVQLPEETPEDSEARKAGYKTIPEIAKERIRRAGKKIKEESPLTTQNLDTGFRVFRLDESNYLEVKKSPKEYDQDMLGLFVDNIKADRTDLDLLFGSMLAWGVQLDMPMTTEQVDGCTVYTVNEGDLVACFSDPITDKVIQTMADKMPLRILFRDSCFTDDAQKINIYEQFKQLLDWADDEAFKNIKVI